MEAEIKAEDIVIETPLETTWRKVKEAREGSIKIMEEELLIEKEVLALAERKLKEIREGDRGKCTLTQF